MSKQPAKTTPTNSRPAATKPAAAAARPAAASRPSPAAKSASSSPAKPSMQRQTSATKPAQRNSASAAPKEKPNKDMEGFRKVQAIAEDHKRKRAQFVDKDFPAGPESLWQDPNDREGVSTS